jgi:hypothetical protein
MTLWQSRLFANSSKNGVNTYEVVKLASSICINLEIAMSLLSVKERIVVTKQDLSEQINARDENSYVSLNLHYKSRLAPVAGLRPEIKVELNARSPLLPTAALPVGSMLDALIQAPKTDIRPHKGSENAMDTLQDVEKKLSAIRPELKKKFKVNIIGVFGSVARGEESAVSDIDLLVDLDDDADLIDMVGLSQHLEEQLHRKIDIVPRRAIRPELSDRILRETIYL